MSVFLLLAVGYVAKKVRVLKSEDSALLGTVVLYFTLPAFEHRGSRLSGHAGGVS